MAWIDIKDSRPEEGDRCWLHDKEGNIFLGTYHEVVPTYDDLPAVVYKCGFCLDESEGRSALIDEITHWMLFFTPAPPDANLKLEVGKSEDIPEDL